MNGTAEQIALKALVEELKRELSPILAVPRNYFNEREASQYLGGISVHSLRKWRTQQTGPVYYRVGNRILYGRDALDTWVQTHRIERDKG